MKIHINCDMGESYGRYALNDDAALMPYIDACNIACGYHAGDPIVIDRTIEQSLKAQIQIGAHPSYPDLQGFGRRQMNIAPDELEAMIRFQISGLMGMVKSQGGNLTHVKTHGALYNFAATDAPTATAVAKAIISIDNNLILYAPYKSIQTTIAKRNGLKVWEEAFLDRRYNQDGSLVSRKLQNAIISKPELVREQAFMIFYNHKVKASKNQIIDIKADTFCIHGDNPAALDILKYISDEKK